MKLFNDIMKKMHKFYPDFIEAFQQIAASPATAEVYKELLKRDKSTALEIMETTRLPEASVYRAINRLRYLGIIILDTYRPRKKGSRGGPREAVWRLV